MIIQWAESNYSSWNYALIVSVFLFKTEAKLYYQHFGILRKYIYIGSRLDGGYHKLNLKMCKNEIEKAYCKIIFCRLGIISKKSHCVLARGMLNLEATGLNFEVVCDSTNYWKSFRILKGACTELISEFGFFFINTMSYEYGYREIRSEGGVATFTPTT